MKIKSLVVWLFAFVVAAPLVIQSAAAQSSASTTLSAYEALRELQPGFAVHTNLHTIPEVEPVKVEPKKASKPTRVARTSPKPKSTSKSGKQKVEVIIDLSEQKMRVKVGGEQKYSWTVSSGRKGHRTPTGWYKPTRMYREYYSKKYYNSPMPHSIFFRGGYAIHGTFQTSALGYPASHGCVRLSPSNAKKLYNLVQANGRSRTSIRVKK